MTREAPAVLAVIVVQDPGERLEESLQALAELRQDTVTFLFLDAGSSPEVIEAIREHFPEAFYEAVGDRGISKAINEAVARTEGATHVLLCSDDVAPEPTALTHMLIEAYRNNAGIVAPKLVAWDDPSRLQSVGLLTDALAVATERVEEEELDQGQHDAVRAIDAAPWGFLLIRRDLFAAIGGLDEDMEGPGLDVDLSWRAYLAGARVIVDPFARVRLWAQARGAGRGGESLQRFVRQRRNEIRTALKCHFGPHLLLVVALLVALSGMELLLSAALGNLNRASGIMQAWYWNIAHLGSLGRCRRQARGYRARSAREFYDSFLSHPVRLARFVESVYPEESGRLRARLHDPTVVVIERRARRLLAFYAVVGIVVLIGARNLFFSRFPSWGSDVGWGGLGGVAAAVVGGEHGLGFSQPPSPLALIMLALSVLLGGSPALARTALHGMLLGIAPIGMLHLASTMAHDPLKKRFYPALAASVYYVLPPAFLGSMASGDFRALAAWSLCPYALMVWVAVSRRIGTSETPLVDLAAGLTPPCLGAAVLVAFVPSFLVLFAILAAAELGYRSVVLGKDALGALKAAGAFFAQLGVFELPVVAAGILSLPHGVQPVLGGGFEGYSVAKLLLLDLAPRAGLFPAAGVLAVGVACYPLARRVNPELDKFAAAALIGLAVAVPEASPNAPLGLLPMGASAAFAGCVLACFVGGAVSALGPAALRSRAQVAALVACCALLLPAVGVVLGAVGNGRLGAGSGVAYKAMVAGAGDQVVLEVADTNQTGGEPVRARGTPLYFSLSGAGSGTPAALYGDYGKVHGIASELKRLVLERDEGALAALRSMGFSYVWVSGASGASTSVRSLLLSSPNATRVVELGASALYYIGPAANPANRPRADGVLLLVWLLGSGAVVVAALVYRVRRER